MRRKGPKGWGKKCRNCGHQMPKESHVCPACKTTQPLR